MELVNLVDYDSWHIEILSKNNISISPTRNNSGDLFLDDNDNQISDTVVGCGKKDIVEMTSNTNGNIILYNDEDKFFQFIDSTFTENDSDKFFMLTMHKSNKYKINAQRKISTNITDGNKINVDLTNESVFKIILNNEEITNYTYDDTGITIILDDLYYVSEFNNRAIVYTYLTDQTVSGVTLFKYYSPVSFFSTNLNDYIDNTFFSGMERICNFNEFSNNHSRSFLTSNRAYKTNQRQLATDRNIAVSLTYKEDLWKIVGLNYFRIVGWSKKLSRMVIFNNCLIQNGEDFTFQKLDTNTYSYNIGIDDYIVLNFSGTPEYINYTLLDNEGVNK